MWQVGVKKDDGSSGQGRNMRAVVRRKMVRAVKVDNPEPWISVKKDDGSKSEKR